MESLRYVALGDSYTIGTSVGEPDRWPNQLVGRLAGTVPLEVVANLGVNGYTSGDLIDDELPQLDALHLDFVTVLIGVNDVVQRVPESTYRTNVAFILDTLLSIVAAGRIVVVSTPDYTLTPHGADFGNPVAQRAQLTLFNTIMSEAAAHRAVPFVDIGPIADQAAIDRSLVARDGLHPSRVQYSRWVDLIAPVVIATLGSSPL